MRRPRSRFTVQLSILALLVSASLFSSCTDKDSSLGGPWYPDTLQIKTVARTDTGFLRMANFDVRKITIPSNVTYSLTSQSPLMLIGKVSQPTENLEAWGVLRFPILSPDSLRRVTGIKLILKTIGYIYGDTTSSHIDLQVRGEGGGKVNDSTTTLKESDLTAATFGTFTQDLADSNHTTISIPIDTSIKVQLTATSFAFVIKPAAMTNVRGFGTKETADTTERPILEYTIKGDTGVTIVDITPSLDQHVLVDINTPTPQHEFSLRGTLGQRESVYLDLNRPGDSVQLNQFSTINNAELILRLDPANSRHSGLAFDTLGPVIALLTTANDSGASYYANGTYDPKDRTLIHFQIRSLVEGWLRNPTQNFGIELRSGLSTRSFAGSVYTVEDNTLNRWTFYGQDATDPANRPKFILSYSKLK